MRRIRTRSGPWSPWLLEIYRTSALGFEQKAKDARFVAYLLSKGISNECLSAAATCCGYDEEPPSSAVREAFRRESALALELIVKAVIAQKIHLGIAPPGVLRIKSVHDLPRLWTEAALPPLSSEDQGTLLEVKSLLNWAGRYQAPKTDAQYYQETAAYAALGLSSPREHFDGLFDVRKVPILDWANFDRLYQIANRELWKLVPG